MQVASIDQLFCYKNNRRESRPLSTLIFFGILLLPLLVCLLLLISVCLKLATSQMVFCHYSFVDCNTKFFLLHIRPFLLLCCSLVKNSPTDATRVFNCQKEKLSKGKKCQKEIRCAHEKERVVIRDLSICIV